MDVHGLEIRLTYVTTWNIQIPAVKKFFFKCIFDQNCTLFKSVTERYCNIFGGKFGFYKKQSCRRCKYKSNIFLEGKGVTFFCVTKQYYFYL